jgi:hypothetical protein
MHEPSKSLHDRVVFATFDFLQLNSSLSLTAADTTVLPTYTPEHSKKMQEIEIKRKAAT